MYSDKGAKVGAKRTNAPWPQTSGARRMPATALPVSHAIVMTIHGTVQAPDGSGFRAMQDHTSEAQMSGSQASAAAVSLRLHGSCAIACLDSTFFGLQIGSAISNDYTFLTDIQTQNPPFSSDSHAFDNACRSREGMEAAVPRSVLTSKPGMSVEPFMGRVNTTVPSGPVLAKKVAKF